MLPHWGGCLAALSFLVYFKLKDEVPKIYAVTILYLLCTSNAVICFRVLSAEVVHPTQMTFLLSTTCFSAFVITLFAFAATGLKKIDCEKILSKGLPIIGTFSATIYVFFGWQMIPHTSSNCTVMAVSIPYLMPRNTKDWKRWLALALILVAIVGSNTSSPMGVAAVVIASHLFLRGANRFWLLLAPLPVIAGGFVYGWHKIFDDTGRFSAYRFFMGEWMSDDQTVGNILLGYASGSFEVLSQIFQHRRMFHLWIDTAGKLRGELYMHLHSDALQYVFEYGLLGAGLLGCCAFRLYKDLSGHTSERVVLLGGLSAMIFDFPVRYPALPLILLLLLGVSLNKTKQ